jgi:hypothetical protein
MISRGGEQGFFVTLYRIILVVGGTIGLLWLGFPNKKKKETEHKPPAEKSTSVHKAPTIELPRQEWMGDPEGNRRRLKIILVVFALLGIGIAILIATQ